ncbi:hypothetical protein GCM10028790_19800 [Micromonospora taraxaci]
MVVSFLSELGDEFVDVVGGVGQQEVEAIFLGLRVMAAHELHGLLEPLRHAVEASWLSGIGGAGTIGGGWVNRMAC